MIQDFVRAARTLLLKEVENYADDLTRGQPVDFAAYKELCGKIQGLRLAEQIITDLAKRAEKHDDDDE